MLEIPAGCTRTREYLASLAAESEDDPVMSVSGSYGVPLPIIMLFRRDLETPEAKELISLLKRRENEYETPYDSSDNIQVSTTDYSRYYVPQNAERRVAELVFEIAEKAVK